MTTQRKITQEEYIELTDLYSSAIKTLWTALGDEDTLGSACAAAAEARSTVTAWEDPDEAQMTNDFIGAAIYVVQALGQLNFLSGYFASFNSAMNAHLQESLDDWLADGGLRVSYYWKRSGNPSIGAANVFPPETSLGSFVVSGSGQGTFTAGGTVDTNYYGGAQLKLKATTAIGLADIDVTLTCLDEAGEEVEVEGQIPGGTQQNAEIELGTSADRIVQVTDVEISGGTATDAFEILTIEDREIA